MAKQQTDDELNLRRKARRRLIGAVALTLAVVVILPMVLDREPKISGKDIDLSIPDPNKAGKFAPGVVVPDSASPSTGSAVAAAPVVAPVQAPEAAKPVAAPAQQKKEAPAKAQPASPEPAETGNTAKPVSAEGFVAQIGAYSNQDTAKQELKKLKHWGWALIRIATRRRRLVISWKNMGTIR
jgi:DedD protein